MAMASVSLMFGYYSAISPWSWPQLSPLLRSFSKLPNLNLSLDEIMGQGDEAHNAEDDVFTDSCTETENTAASGSTTAPGPSPLLMNV